MKLGDFINVRTGLVFSRKQALLGDGLYAYNALNLKCINIDGKILMESIEEFSATENLNEECLTRRGDVLLRLSTPYTATLIGEGEVELLVPSHFAIMRSGRMVDPRYLCWWLTKNRKMFYRSASGSSTMGTISSGYIADMDFAPPTLEVQEKIGELLDLTGKEQHLLALLAEKKQQLIDGAINEILMKENL